MNVPNMSSLNMGVIILIAYALVVSMGSLVTPIVAWCSYQHAKLPATMQIFHRSLDRHGSSMSLSSESSSKEHMNENFRRDAQPRQGSSNPPDRRIVLERITMTMVGSIPFVAPPANAETTTPTTTSMVRSMNSVSSSSTVLQIIKEINKYEKNVLIITIEKM